MWQMELLAIVFYDEVASLMGSPQHVHLLPCPQDGWTPSSGSLGVHDLHDAPLGKPHLVVAHYGVIPHRVRGFPILEVGIAAT